MAAMGWHNAVERLREGARSGGASSGLSTALSLGFGVLLLGVALAGPRPPEASTAEQPTPAEEAAPMPPDTSEPSRAAVEDRVQAAESFAMARIELPPPPAAIAAAERPAPLVQPEPHRLAPLAVPPAEPLAARPALAPPAPTPAAAAAKPHVVRRSEPVEKRPAKPIKALEAETELARESSPPMRVESLRSELAKRSTPLRKGAAPAEPTDIVATPDPAPASLAIRVGDAAAPEAVEGRALLHILEHGSGPGIVIAWPGSAGERSALYSLLTRCYGVHTALLDSAGNLYRADRAGAWTPNTDRYSSFLRQVEGRLPAGERSTVATIQRRHPGTRRSSTVRLFPRNVDAVLLGGLRRIVGDHYGDASRISASYARSGQTVVIEDIRVDGTTLPGRVALTPPRYCPAAGSS